jgi:hypothetical protein
VKASTGGIVPVTTSLGTVVVLNTGTTTTVYYVIDAALPSSGIAAITITATATSSAPRTPTFSISPEPPYTSTAAPSSSYDLFVNTANHFGLVWGFTKNNSGVWTGNATWYHNSSSKISLVSGRTYTLTNSTSDSALTYSVVDASTLL